MRSPLHRLVCLAALCLIAVQARAQYGIVLSGAGPVNRSMGGASVGAALDATGALYWNPASIGGLRRNEAAFGAELLMPHARLGSRVPAGGFGPLGPPVALSGSDPTDTGASPIPTMAAVWRPEGSPLTFGAGLMLVGGYAANYPASTTNPILTPQPPTGLGLGPLSSDLQVFQFVPTVAWEVAPCLHVGFAPTLTMARLTADPFFIAPPDDANGDRLATYPAGTHTRYSFGAGFQAGVYYEPSQEWAFGASIKSPQWLEGFRYKSADERGRPRNLDAHFDYPMIISVGGSYKGLESWLFAADVRYIDYRNTRGFEDVGFAPTGAVRGLGWDNVFALALGAQWQATCRLSLRAGYSYNTNPIDEDRTMFNVASPLLLMHTVYLGASYALTDNLVLTAAYAHAFENSSEGPYLTPLGAVPGASVRSEISCDSFMIGLRAFF